MNQLSILSTGVFALCAFAPALAAQAKEVEPAAQGKKVTAAKSAAAVAPLWQFQIKGISG